MSLLEFCQWCRNNAEAVKPEMWNIILSDSATSGEFVRGAMHVIGVDNFPVHLFQFSEKPRKRKKKIEESDSEDDLEEEWEEEAFYSVWTPTAENDVEESVFRLDAIKGPKANITWCYSPSQIEESSKGVLQSSTLKNGWYISTHTQKGFELDSEDMIKVTAKPVGVYDLEALSVWLFENSHVPDPALAKRLLYRGYATSKVVNKVYHHICQSNSLLINHCPPFTGECNLCRSTKTITKKLNFFTWELIQIILMRS